MVLLQHRLQPGACFKAVHWQPHQRVAFGGGQPQGIIQAERRVGCAEFLGVFEIARPQFDPGSLVLHQWAALARQALQVLQGQGDPADHQLPGPVEVFAQAEATSLRRQFCLDRKAKPAG